MKFLRVIYSAIFVCALLCTDVAVLAATTAQVRVNAAVLPYMRINATQHAATYSVSNDDLIRGYVDLPNIITVTVRTNIGGMVPVIVDNSAKDGILLVRESGTGTFIDGSFYLNTTGHQPGAVISREYDSRIVLPADMKIGIYSLAITMMPAI